MTLRTLLVKLGFKGDITKLTAFNNKVKGLKTNILGLTAVFTGLTASLGYFLHEAAKLEQTKIAFEVMTNSVELGQKLIKDLFRFARTTPFQIPGVLQASKILLAMGVTAEEQLPVLTSLGHVAAGIDKPLDQLASIFGRVRAAGYLTGYEMERLRRAGVPLGAYLSELLKKPEKDILQMIRRKEISYEIFAEGWELMVEKRFPKLMDRLLTTFNGIMSNIKDYIYEIVAFSGEELLPVFKLMATQLMFLLDSSRDLIGLKFKQFFGTISDGLFLLNKLFVRMYYRTREVTSQLGGFNKIFKIFATLFGTMLGVKSLALLGRLGKMIMSFLSPMALKLALIGAAMIGILAVTEDILGYLSGKESLIGRILDWIEVRFPEAFKHIHKWLVVLKKEIEGFTLLSIGLFEGLKTGDWSMAKAGLSQISEAYKKAMQEVSREKVSVFDPFQDVDVEGMNFIEGTIAQSNFLKSIAGGLEKIKQIVVKLPEKRVQAEKGIEGAFFPGGKPAPTPIDLLTLFEGRNVLGPLQTEALKAFTPRTATEKIIQRGSKLREGLGMERANINLTNNINIDKLPENANAKEVVERIKNEVTPLVESAIDHIVRSGNSFAEPEQF